MKKGSEDDPKGLIFEAYRIDGITAPECRTIFLDWALSMPEGTDSKAAIKRLLALYDQPGHPMSAVLSDGLAQTGAPRRRGGWRARSR